MRRNSVIARFRKLVLAFVACLVFSVLAPMFFAERRSEEHFAGSSVLASPRDRLELTVPVKLSDAPDLTLVRSIVSDYGLAAAGGTMSHLVLEAPVLTFNAAATRGSSKTVPGEVDGIEQLASLYPLIRQLAASAYERVTIRRGTLNIVTADGSVVICKEIEAEVSRRNGQIEIQGSFSIRGQRLAFVATLGQPLDKKGTVRRPLQATFKGNLIQGSFDGQLDLVPDLQLTGTTEISTPSLRRVGRWFGIPLESTDGFNAATVKAELTWARRVLAFEKARLTVDGSEANGRVVLNLGGERPLIDVTLDFSELDLTPHLDAARLQLFGFELPGTSWPSFDISLPMIRYLDADLRISARKVMLKGHAFGQGAASITASAGKLQADITELELGSGILSAQITAIMTDAVPKYALRAKIEGVDTGPASTLLLGAAVLTGRATIAADVTSAGYTLHEIIARMRGKASLALPDGGRVALDAKVLSQAAKAGTHGWARLARSPASVDKLEVQADIYNGIAFPEKVEVLSGNLTLAASGRLDLDDGYMDVRLTWKQTPSADQPPKPAGTSGETVSLRGPWYAPIVRSE
jgi:AsmA protein